MSERPTHGPQELTVRRQTPLAMGQACNVSDVECVADIAWRHWRASHEIDLYDGRVTIEERRGAFAEMRAWLSSEHYREAVAKLQQATSYASEREVRNELALLVGGFPNAARADLKSFGTLLALDVLSKAPCRYAISKAVIKLRQTAKFMPTIADVLEAIKDADEYIRLHERVTRELPLHSERLERKLAEIEEREKCYAAERAERDRRKIPKDLEP